MERLNQLIEKVSELDTIAMKECRNKLDSIAKPLDGFGTYEKILIKLSGIYGTADFTINKRGLIVMCSDNGVVDENISQSDYSVTTTVAEHIAAGTGTVSIMAKSMGVDVFPVDIGIKGNPKTDLIYSYKIANGTKNIAREPAMTQEELLLAIHVGIEMVHMLKNKGYNIIATGEMGIGNTTTSSAIASVLLDIPVQSLTGRGAGLSDEKFEHKLAIIDQAISVNNRDKSNPFDIVSKLGGFDIAGLIGVFLGGAIYKIPIVIDGVISAVSALLAEQICDKSKVYMLASHLGKEPACQFLLDKLGLTPIIHAEMALGEGTGAVMLLPLLDTVMTVYHHNTTFDDMQLEQYERFNK